MQKLLKFLRRQVLNESKLDAFYTRTFFFAIIALFFSFGLGVYGHLSTQSSPPTGAMRLWFLSTRRIEGAVLIGWIVLPPIYFWCEYFGIYKVTRDFEIKAVGNPADWDRFKYGQDLSAKVWLAVTTALLLLYFGKELRH